MIKGKKQYCNVSGKESVQVVVNDYGKLALALHDGVSIMDTPRLTVVLSKDQVLELMDELDMAVVSGIV